MIRIVQGNLFQSSAQTLVNAVNCDGFMGRGLSKGFRERWPSMFLAYHDACLHGEVSIGRPFLFRAADRQILNVPTRERWKSPSRYDFVEAGLEAIRDRHQEWGITSIALPALGCGLGGLDWGKVRPMIERAFSAQKYQVLSPVVTTAV